MVLQSKKWFTNPSFYTQFYTRQIKTENKIIQVILRNLATENLNSIPGSWPTSVNCYASPRNLNVPQMFFFLIRSSFIYLFNHDFYKDLLKIEACCPVKSGKIPKSSF